MLEAKCKGKNNTEEEIVKRILTGWKENEGQRMEDMAKKKMMQMMKSNG